MSGLKWRLAGLLAGLVVAEVLSCVPARAKMMMPQSVPVDRLIKNVGAYVEKNPKDAQGYFILGRLHALAFARGPEPVQVYRYGRDEAENTTSLPSFPYDARTEVSRTSTDPHLTAEARTHLLESVRSYQRAAQLAPREAVHWLGLGWILEQGVNYIGDVGLPPGEPERKVSDRAKLQLWVSKAAYAYRQAYNLAIKQDLAGSHMIDSEVISKEAGEGLIRLAPKRDLSPAQKAELKDIADSIAKIKIDRRRIISPIIFPLHDVRPLESLLSPGSSASFDLAGDGQSARWPWLNPDTGILVWDPQHTGRVTSGRQLFGSVTWWMFWRDGYEPLAALDDNHDGWLSGHELDGIAVWCDRNGNGVSDPGEVVPLATFAITKIAVHSDGRENGAPANSHGLRRTDGTYLPTYDWTPKSLVPGPHR